MWHAVPNMKSRLHYIPAAAPRFFYGFINGLCDFALQVGFRCFVDRKVAPIAIGVKSNSRRKFIG